MGFEEALADLIEKHIITMTKQQTACSNGAVPAESVGAGDTEITPQMVRAGVAAYRQFDRDYDSDEEMVLAVYLAIRQQQSSGSFR